MTRGNNLIFTVSLRASSELGVVMVEFDIYIIGEVALLETPTDICHLQQGLTAGISTIHAQLG